MKKLKSSAALGGLLVMIAGCLWGCTGLFVGRINAAGIAAMEAVEPACATLLQIVVLRVLPDGFTLVGILLVLGAIVWLNLGTEKA